MQKVFFSCLLFSILFIFTVPIDADAQLTTTVSQNDSSVLSLFPQYPEPNEQVVATLNDYSINTNGSTIQWFVDGIEVVRAKNERSLEFPSGNLGERSEIIAITTLPNGTVLRAKSSIVPVRVDMLIEADSRVPSFYKGRSIPSSGGSVQVTALPFTGEDRSPTSFSYTWRVDSEVLGGGARFGKNSVQFVAGFKKEILVSVDVIDVDGSVVTSENVYIPLTDPELYFYEVNPLRGMSEIAMDKDFIFIGEEVKVRAEPYFIDNDLFSQNPFQEWKLDRHVVENPNSDQQEIILRRSGDSGSFNLEYHVRNLKQLLQGIKDDITVHF